MLKSLWILQWKSLFSRMQKGRGRKLSGGVQVLLMLFLLLCVEVFALVIFAELSPLCKTGFTWLYFAMAGTAALAFSVLGSVFTTQAQLYDAKDNELLLSMPIPPKYILVTRVSVLLAMTAGYTLAVLLPACAVYAFSYGASVPAVIGWIFAFVSLSLFAQTICCVLGRVLHALLTRLRNKAFVSLLYMVAFMAVYYYFCANINSVLSELVARGNEIANAMQSYAWPLYAVGAACSGSLPHTAIITVLSAALAALVFWRLSATFIRSVNAQGAKAGGKRKAGKCSMRPRSALHSVAHKELRRFLTSPAYLMNFGFGLVLLPVLPIAAAFFRGTLMRMIQMTELPNTLVALCVFCVLAFCISTSCATAPSVSLEGKSLWILRTMPVSGKTVLLGKLLMVCRLQMPLSALSALALCLILNCGALLTVLTVCTAVGFCWFVSTLGLIMNLLAPRFDWRSENQPCKQSLSVFVTMFGAYFFAAAAAGVFLLLIAAGVAGTVAYALMLGFVLLASALMHLLLVHWGAKRFERLPA